MNFSFRRTAARRRVPKRCLWDAFKAFILGLSLVIIGVGVAIMGYFSDRMVPPPDAQGDRGLVTMNGTTLTHLNNLSYVGPIISCLGGFIIVIACMMAFEAHDNASKIVPSKFEDETMETSLTQPNIETLERTMETLQRRERRSTMKFPTPGKTARKKTLPLKPGAENPFAPVKKPVSGALTQFSRSLADRFPSQGHRWGKKSDDGKLNKSPSAPDLWEAIPDELLDELLATGRGGMPPPDKGHGDPSRPLATVPSSMLPRFTRLKLETLSMDNPFSDICDFYTPMCIKPIPQNKNIHEFVTPLSMKSSRKLSQGITDLDALSRRPSQRLVSGITEFDAPLVIKPLPKLRKGFSESSAPLALKYSQQHVDDICEFDSLPVEPPRLKAKDFDSDPDDFGSQASMALDLHECQVTIKVKDETASKRSETARRHLLQRQKPVEEESPSALLKYPGFAKVVLPPKEGKIDVGTTMSPKLGSPIHQCCSEPGKIRKTKPKVDFRSQSTYIDPFEGEGTSKIFYIDDYPGPSNYSYDNIRSAEREEPISVQRGSPKVSFSGLSRQGSLKCLFSKDSWNGAGKKMFAKLKESLSVEEKPTPRVRFASQRRSLSFSPSKFAPF